MAEKLPSSEQIIQKCCGNFDIKRKKRLYDLFQIIKPFFYSPAGELFNLSSSIESNSPIPLQPELPALQSLRYYYLQNQVP